MRDGTAVPRESQHESLAQVLERPGPSTGCKDQPAATVGPRKPRKPRAAQRRALRAGTRPRSACAQQLGPGGAGADRRPGLHGDGLRHKPDRRVSARLDRGGRPQRLRRLRQRRQPGRLGRRHEHHRPVHRGRPNRADVDRRRPQRRAEGRSDHPPALGASKRGRQPQSGHHQPHDGLHDHPLRLATRQRRRLRRHCLPRRQGLHQRVQPGQQPQHPDPAVVEVTASRLDGQGDAGALRKRHGDQHGHGPESDAEPARPRLP